MTQIPVPDLRPYRHELAPLDFDVVWPCESRAHATTHMPGDPAAYAVTFRPCQRCEQGDPDSTGTVCESGMDQLRGFASLTHPCGYGAPTRWWIKRVIPLGPPWLFDVCPCGSVYTCVRGRDPLLRGAWLTHHNRHSWTHTTTEETR